MKINLNTNNQQYQNKASCKSLNTNNNLLLAMDSKSILINA